MMFAQRVAQVLEENHYIRPISSGITGAGSLEGDGTASFQVFGAGLADPDGKSDKKAISTRILGMYLKLLLLTEDFTNEIVVAKQYQMRQVNGQPRLVQGYMIAGVCETSGEKEQLLHALSRTEPLDMKKFVRIEANSPLISPQSTARTDDIEREHRVDRPPFVHVMSDLLRRYQIMKPIERVGDGFQDGPHGASFQVFGPGPENRQLILDMFLRILVATRTFSSPVICARRYKAKRMSNGIPRLVQGYLIAGMCKDAEEKKIMFDTLDLSEYEPPGKELEALFWSVLADGSVVPSGDRNIPNAGVGEKGMRGAHTVGQSGGLGAILR